MYIYLSFTITAQNHIEKVYISIEAAFLCRFFGQGYFKELDRDIPCRKKCRSHKNNVYENKKLFDRDLSKNIFQKLLLFSRRYDIIIITAIVRKSTVNDRKFREKRL